MPGSDRLLFFRPRRLFTGGRPHQLEDSSHKAMKLSRKPCYNLSQDSESQRATKVGWRFLLLIHPAPVTPVTGVTGALFYKEGLARIQNRDRRPDDNF
jgi:hypothetical protein